MSETRRHQLFQPETFLMNFQHRCESICSYKKTDFTLIMVQDIRSNLFQFYCIKGHTIDFLEVLFTDFPSSSIGIFFFKLSKRYIGYLMIFDGIQILQLVIFYRRASANGYKTQSELDKTFEFFFFVFIITGVVSCFL